MQISYQPIQVYSVHSLLFLPQGGGGILISHPYQYSGLLRDCL